MLYEYPLTVPAGTAADAPAELDVKLTAGVITRIECDFAQGCNHYVYAYVRQGLHQIWPLNPDGQARGNGAVIGSDEYYEISADVNDLTVGAYSPGATYDHEIHFRIEITPKDIAEIGKNSEGLITKVLALLGVG